MIREEEEEEEESTPSLQRAWCLGNRGPVLRRGAPYCHHLKRGVAGSVVAYGGLKCIPLVLNLASCLDGFLVGSVLGSR